MSVKEMLSQAKSAFHPYFLQGFECGYAGIVPGFNLTSLDNLSVKEFTIGLKAGRRFYASRKKN